MIVLIETVKARIKRKFVLQLQKLIELTKPVEKGDANSDSLALTRGYSGAWRNKLFQLPLMTEASETLAEPYKHFACYPLAEPVQEMHAKATELLNVDQV